MDPISLTLQPVMVATGEEGEGCLVFADSWLIAILVRLSDLHDDRSGCWFLEKGFGMLDVPGPPSFENLDAAQDWIREQLARGDEASPVRG